ncbi:glycerophosphodiester phosphodiesterase family protein [Rhodoluna sp.]|jgi:glycerophosphoryl diester phosphodiesterase|uniref:glycerophosphodiester phosphodiesterase family protein n=1 Tax=Rhodoluna sp. TaxID=1969481 RepID=UPI0025E5638F|nr:glycerophosphodiester phosphodiesterase family protein [Rhodoluna sp.]
MASKKSYWSTLEPRIFAHRGLVTLDSPDENTVPAFRAAVLAGADYIESDLQLTSDGVPVLFHDADLLRVAGLNKKISQVSWAELQDIRLLRGGHIPRLEDVLKAFSGSKFNLDFKSDDVVAPAAAVINKLRCHNRVLVTSFSDARRRRAVSLMDSPVATSAGSITVVLIYIASYVPVPALGRLIARDVDCLQIPVGNKYIHFDTKRFIRYCRSIDLSVYFWTINKKKDMKRLVGLGAAGIVTDKCDLAIEAFATSL